ncbi:MAG: flagella basal body P-ring formation protein FlgA [Candidatus Latescibacteria bacterium 4484_181]|nr:MAG: flagella basal body P-ring formation protein FlgA [Candidatus Latescibacteria bacterium 4484_181]
MASKRDRVVLSARKLLFLRKTTVVAFSHLLFLFSLNTGSACIARTLVSSQQIDEAVRDYVLRSASWPEDSLQVSCRRHMTADVRLFHAVVVASQRVKRGELLTPQVLKLETREVTCLEGRYFTRIEQLQGKRARLSIPLGAVLTPETVEPVPVVSRGSKVRILVQFASVVAWTEGAALQEGAPGELIRVRNLRSGKRVLARVLDSETVRVIF